jgi:hypothetical protein
MDGWPRALVDVRLALSRGIRSLERGFLPGDLRVPSGSPITDALLEVASLLTAGRDLLNTHFGAGPAGSRVPVSEWAPVITSPQVTKAVAAEVAACARQMTPIVTRLAQVQLTRSRHGGRPARPARHGESARLRERLREACEELWKVSRAFEHAQGRDRVEAADRELLYAIPLNSLPARERPGVTETIETLCAGVTKTAERVRQATWAGEPAWAPGISSTSLRHTAASGVVISHNCEVALAGLAARAHRFGLGDTSVLLGEAAAAAGRARAGWLEAARAWGAQIVTETEGRRTRVCVEAEDLAVWTGRLVYADPQWLPRHGRSTDLRPPAQLAGDPAELRRVVAAVYGAGQTLSRLAETELVQLQAVAAAGRLYVPTRSLPMKADVPRRYGPAPRDRVGVLEAVYRDARLASSRLAIATGEAVRPSPAPRLEPPPGPAARPSITRRDEPTLEVLQGPVVSLLRRLGVFDPDLLLRGLELEEAAGLPSPGLPRRRVLAADRRERELAQQRERAKGRDERSGARPADRLPATPRHDQLEAGGPGSEVDPQR